MGAACGNAASHSSAGSPPHTASPGGQKNKKARPSEDSNARPARRRRPRINLAGCRQGGKHAAAENFGYLILSSPRCAAERRSPEITVDGRGHQPSKSSRIGRDRGPNARNCCHSSPAGAVSIGPSGLDRRTGAVHSSVRSRDIVGSQPTVPRRHHCRPAASSGGVWHARRGLVGRILSLGLADRRMWTVGGAPDHSG